MIVGDRAAVYLVAVVQVQPPDADAVVTVADAGAWLTAAGRERAGQDLPAGVDLVAGTVGRDARVPTAVVEVGVIIRHSGTAHPIDWHTGAAGGSIVAGIHLTSRDERAELVAECANGGVAVISGGTDYLDRCNGSILLFVLSSRWCRQQTAGGIDPRLPARAVPPTNLPACGARAAREAAG